MSPRSQIKSQKQETYPLHCQFNLKGLKICGGQATTHLANYKPFAWKARYLRPCKISHDFILLQAYILRELNTVSNHCTTVHYGSELSRTKLSKVETQRPDSFYNIIILFHAFLYSTQLNTFNFIPHPFPLFFLLLLFPPPLINSIR